MASFPTSIITTATLVTPTANQPTNNPSHSNAHVLINGEIIAVETNLGTNPQGSFATVSARLTTYGTSITTAQTTASSALTAASVAQTTANTAVAAASTAQSTANTAVTLANVAQTTANTAVTLANTAQTTANAKAVYPGAGVPNSTGSAWTTSYSVGTAANDLVQLNGSGQLPAVDGSLLKDISSNFLFQYQGCIDASGALNGEIENSSLVPVSFTGIYRFLAIDGTAGAGGVQVWSTKFLKIPGISTVTILCRLWTQSSGNAKLIVTIGGQTGNVAAGIAVTTPTWVSFTIDVSSLTNGTVYDVIAKLGEATNTNIPSYCANIIGIGG